MSKRPTAKPNPKPLTNIGTDWAGGQWHVPASDKAATRTIMCPRTDCRNVFQIPDTSAHDAETVRLVREWIKRELREIGRFSQDPHERGTRMCCQSIRSILNRPAKKGKKNDR